MFYKITGEIYREILSQEDGTWIISYDYPQSPCFYISQSDHEL